MILKCPRIALPVFELLTLRGRFLEPGGGLRIVAGAVIHVAAKNVDARLLAFAEAICFGPLAALLEQAQHARAALVGGEARQLRQRASFESQQAAHEARWRARSSALKWM